MTPREKLKEAMADAMAREFYWTPLAELSDFRRGICFAVATNQLDAIEALGAVIVPKVATADMLATYEAHSHHSDGQWERFTISQDDYTAMLAASPYRRAKE